MLNTTAFSEPPVTSPAARRAVLPLHRYLSALIWWSLVPLLLLAGALAAYHVVKVGVDIDAEGARAAAALANAVEQGLKSRARGLSMLADSGLLDEPTRMAEFHALAASYQRTYGSHVLLADTEQRMLLNTRLPWGAPLPPLPRPRGRAAVPLALQTGQVAVGDLFFGPVSNTQMVALAMPVLRGGKAQAALLTVFEAAWFDPLIDAVALAPGWSFAVLDSSGQVIARRGAQPPPAAGQASSGDHRFGADLKMAPWRVVVDVPETDYRAPALRMGATLALAVVLATLAGLLGGRRAAGRLSRALDALAPTDPPPSVPPSIPPEDRQREIAEVAIARARLREATTRRELAERQREAASADARHAHAVLQETMARIGDGVAAFGRDGRFTYANERAAQMLGRTHAHELVGRLLTEVVPEAEASEWHAACAQALASTGPLVREAFIASSQRWIENRLFPADDGVSIHLSDVTERREARRALENYQRDLSELTQRLLHQERETSRHIAQMLHDHLGQSLAVARLRLDAIHVGHGATMAGPLKQECAHIGEAINQAIADVRLVLSDLRPQLLEEQGLTAALDNEIRERSITAGHVSVVLDVDGPTLAVRWPADVEYAALMIAREAIVNAQQHARASQVVVRVEGDGHWLRLAVQDDGIGIAEALAQGRPGHLGLVGMRERALAIAANLQVEALAEGGSRVQLMWKEDNE